FRSLGRDFLDPRIGIGLAIAGIAAIAWSNIRRQRARQRHGLAALSFGAIAARIAIPSIVIVAFIFLMNKAGGVPIPVIFLLAVAIAGAFLTRTQPSVAIFTPSAAILTRPDYPVL